MFWWPYILMLSTSLFSVVTPDRGLIQAQQYCSILLITLKNAGSKTLFSLVFINPEQVVHFWLCSLCLHVSSRGFGGWSTSDEGCIDEASLTIPHATRNVVSLPPQRTC